MDLIALADASDRPFMAMVRKGPKMGNMELKWQADKFDDVRMGGVGDGVPASNSENAAKDRRILNVFGQQFRRVAEVGNLAEDVSDIAGLKSEMARALDKKREELSRDMEATLCSDQDTQEETGPEAPYLTRGLGEWIKATAQAAEPVDELYRTPAASITTTAIASTTEDGVVRPLLKSIYQEHGKSEELTLLCGTDLKEAFTAMTKFQGSSTNTYQTVRSFNSNLDAGKITNNVTLYEGDFNKVKLVTSLFLGRSTTTGAIQAATHRRGYVMAMDQVMIRPHTFPVIEKLPYLGGSHRNQIRAVLALQVNNPKRFGKFAATS